MRKKKTRTSFVRVFFAQKFVREAEDLRAVLFFSAAEERAGQAPEQEKKPNPLRGIWKSPKKRKRVIWIAVLAVVAV